MANQDTLQK